jgi:hypothetical protein
MTRKSDLTPISIFDPESYNENRIKSHGVVWPDRIDVKARLDHVGET